MRIELLEDENISKTYEASLMLSGSPRACDTKNGYLYLTNLRIVFEPNDNSPQYFVTINYIDIDNGGISGENIGWTVPGTLYCKKNNNTTCFLFFRGCKYTNGSLIAKDINNNFLARENIKEQKKIMNKSAVNRAKKHEKLLEFDEAAQIYKALGMDDEVIRIRNKARNKIEQTVVQGDYVDDRDTIVKDSVINRSNVGGGSSKMQELKDLTEMKEKGLIDDGEFKQMKKEILGK